MKYPLAFIFLFFSSLLASCATYRGMPSHGGGKRFDEEQRIVAAAIREAVAQIELSGIKARKIALLSSKFPTAQYV